MSHAATMLVGPPRFPRRKLTRRENTKRPTAPTNLTLGTKTHHVARGRGLLGALHKLITTEALPRVFGSRNAITISDAKVGAARASNRLVPPAVETEGTGVEVVGIAAIGFPAHRDGDIGGEAGGDSNSCGDRGGRRDARNGRRGGRGGSGGDFVVAGNDVTA